MSFSFGNFQFNPEQAKIDKIKLQMNYSKRSRFTKGLTSPFYLLNVSNNGSEFQVAISGSSGNIYNVVYNYHEKKFICDCPDGKGHCHSSNELCKHSYFLIFRVLKIWDFADSEPNFIMHNTLTDLESQNICEKLHNLQIKLENGGVMDLSRGIDISLFQRYKTFIRTKEDEVKRKEEDVLISKFNGLSIEGESLCPICYNDFNEGDNILKCPECHKSFHKSCMTQWLQTGRNTCVMCRQPVWQEYKDKYMCASHADFYNIYENIYHLAT